jgi:rare lipoprotein A
MYRRRNRPGRIDRFRIALAAACAVLAIVAAPGQAAMGGLGATTAGYGPGLYGNRTACGRILRPGTVGVAHRTLPCGTAVKFVHRGRELVTRVIDRGPFSAGYDWDLTNGARRALGFDGAGRILYALSLDYARDGRR